MYDTILLLRVSRERLILFVEGGGLHGPALSRLFLQNGHCALDESYKILHKVSARLSKHENQVENFVDGIIQIIRKGKNQLRWEERWCFNWRQKYKLKHNFSKWIHNFSRKIIFQNIFFFQKEIKMTKACWITDNLLYRSGFLPPANQNTRSHSTWKTQLIYNLLIVE